MPSGTQVAALERTGWVRWAPAVSMMLVSLISYIDRNTLALLAPTILAEMHLSAEQYGWIVSAFSIAYMVSNPLWGSVLDRFGLRRGMTAAVLAWTLASVSHAFTRSFAGLAAVRIGLGFGEGATFPGGLRTVVQTLPRESRSRGVALSYSGGSLGALITPIVITPIVAVWGWRSAFWFTGIIGGAWLVLWGFTSRMVEGAAPVAATDRWNVPLRLKDRRVWSFVAAYALGALPLAFILYGASIYLNQALGKTQLQIGTVLWIPPLGWECGYFFWGYLVDRGLKQGTPSLRLHTILMAAAMLFSLPLALTARIGSFPLVLASWFLAMFVAAGFVILAISYATSIYSSEHAGFIAGLGAGSWSAMVAVVMPYFGRLLDGHRYNTAFGIASVFPVLGFAAWWLLSRDRPAVV